MSDISIDHKQILFDEIKKSCSYIFRKRVFCNRVIIINHKSYTISNNNLIKCDIAVCFKDDNYYCLGIWGQENCNDLEILKEVVEEKKEILNAS